GAGAALRLQANQERRLAEEIVVIDDDDGPGGLGDGGADGVAQIDREELVAFLEAVADDGEGQRGAGLAGRNDERAGGGDVVVAGDRRRAVRRGELHRHRLRAGRR